MFDETRQSLEKLGLPKGDLYELTTSGKTFPDGAHFRIEVPTINSFEAFKALLDRAAELGVTINRIDETYGIFRHTLGELRDYCALAKERGVAVNFSVGPRAPYDTGATVHTSQGVRIAYRLRGKLCARWKTSSGPYRSDAAASSSMTKACCGSSTR